VWESARCEEFTVVFGPAPIRKNAADVAADGRAGRAKRDGPMEVFVDPGRVEKHGCGRVRRVWEAVNRLVVTVCANDHNRRVPLRATRSREKPTVGVVAADVDEAGRTGFLKGSDNRAKSRRRVASGAAWGAHGSGSGASADDGCWAASSRSASGSSRISLCSNTLIGTVGAPSIRFSSNTSRSRARLMPT